MKKIFLCLMLVVGVMGVGLVGAEPVFARYDDDVNSGGGEAAEYNPDCTSILNPDWCDMDEGGGIYKILGLVLTILTAGVGILATIGLVISGIQYITSRDDANKVAKAKSRIFNIVLGLLAYGVMWVALQWLIPGGILNGSGGSSSNNSGGSFESGSGREYTGREGSL